jgi:hypothetical protein
MPYVELVYVKQHWNPNVAGQCEVTRKKGNWLWVKAGNNVWRVSMRYVSAYDSFWYVRLASMWNRLHNHTALRTDSEHAAVRRAKAKLRRYVEESIMTGWMTLHDDDKVYLNHLKRAGRSIIHKLV